MTKKTFIISLLIFIGFVVVYGLYFSVQNAGAPTAPIDNSKMVDPLNATYYIDSRQIKLINGRYEESISGSATKIRYGVWDKPIYGDLNGDGISDAAIVIISDNGGSGSFYYIGGTINANGSGFTGTNGVFLGDRIVIRDISINNEEITVSYLDRRAGEPMAASPSVEMLAKFVYKDNVLVIVPDAVTDSNNCEKYGGKVESVLCCASVGDFPNTCMVGACGCAPVNSKQTNICECGEGKCFDGSGCVDIK